MTYRRFGGPEVIEPVDLPAPTPAAGQVLVAVHATSVNPVDWKIASGAIRLLLPVDLPAVPGFDVSGTVLALGPGVTGITVGARVHARIAARPGRACAEQAVVEAEQVVPVPEAMDMGEAAGLPLAGMTALQGLRDVGGLPMAGATQRVLIVGASGGVGHLAVQIAKAAGAHVTGVCSTRNVARVTAWGADAVIDYTQADAWAGAQPWDIVYDCVGGDPGPWLPRVVKGGRYLSCVPTGRTFAWMPLGFFLGKTVRAVLLKPNGPDLAALDALYLRGALRVAIDSRHPLAQLGDAWTRSQSGRAVGKIIVEVG